MNASRAMLAGKRYRTAFEAASSLTARDAFAHFTRAVAANTLRLTELGNVKDLGTSRIVEACASNTGLPPRSVDLVITSPPYCGAQKYVRSLNLELRLLGFSENEIAAIDRQTLGTERLSRQHYKGWLLPNAEELVGRISMRDMQRASMLRDYLGGLSAFASELRRVIKAGANAFVTFGTSHIAGVEVRLARLYAEMAEASGLTLVTMLEDEIPTRGMITKRHSTSGTIAQEYVVWLKSS